MSNLISPIAALVAAIATLLGVFNALGMRRSEQRSTDLSTIMTGYANLAQNQQARINEMQARLDAGDKAYSELEAEYSDLQAKYNDLQAKYNALARKLGSQP